MLTETQIELLDLLDEGLDIEDICEGLQITENTFRVRRQRLQRRLGIPVPSSLSPHDLPDVARRLGVWSPPETVVREG